MTTFGKISAACSLALFVMLSPGVDAQQQRGDRTHSFEIDLRGGIAIPADEFKDLYDVGGSFGAGIYVPVGSRFTVGVDGEVEVYSSQSLGTVCAAVVGGFCPESSPEMNLYHYGARVNFDLIEDSSGFTVTLNAGGGATTFDVDDFAIPVVPGSDALIVVSLDDTYFSATGGVGIEYAVSDNFGLGLSGQGYATFIDRDDSKIFSALTPDVNPFKVAWTFPVSAMVRIKF